MLQTSSEFYMVLGIKMLHTCAKSANWHKNNTKIFPTGWCEVDHWQLEKSLNYDQAFR